MGAICTNMCPCACMCVCVMSSDELRMCTLACVLICPLDQLSLQHYLVYLPAQDIALKILMNKFRVELNGLYQRSVKASVTSAKALTKQEKKELYTKQYREEKGRH